MKCLTMLLACAVLATSMTSFAAEEKMSPLNHTMKDISGTDVDLAKKYDDKVVLIVNVASRCGLTPQYEQLQELHTKYADQGLAVVGFPCNQFGKQEPGTEADIAEFCDTKYGVEFDMMSKVNVNGDDACPLYKELTATKTAPAESGKISWNFEKFLIGKDGQVIARFSPRTKPDAPEVIKAIETALAAE